MTTAGWVFMAVSWIIIIALCAFAFYRVFKENEEDL